MIPALIILASLVLAGAILYAHHRLTGGDATPQDSAAESAPAQPEGCCGQHAMCEKDSLLAAVSQKIEYYDDEELDRFAGREANAYSATEADEFRDVMLTMSPSEVAGWGRSLQLRGIKLPDAVREELLLIVSEQRFKQYA